MLTWGMKRHRVSFPRLTGRLCAAILAVFLTGPCAVASAAEAADKAPKLPAPENINLRTKDFVELNVVYYPAAQGKKTVPVIILHGWDGPRGAGSSADCHLLALHLQQAGHAVAVPDLRGHGGTTRRRLPGPQDFSLNRDEFRVQDFHDMQFDVEAVKSYLLRQNNEGKLNIELLCLVGFDMGAAVGLNWVGYDWSVPPLPTLKQGQDVKAFVLVSPVQSFRGLRLDTALSDPVVRGDLSAMLVYGKDQSTYAAAGKRVYNSLKRAHRDVPEDPKERERLQDLFLVELSTSLQGTKLLTSADLKVPERIAEFIRLRLVNRSDQFPWHDRSRP